MAESRIKTQELTYSQKYANYLSLTLYHQLSERQRKFIDRLAEHLHLTYQEFRKIVEYSRDLEMWQEWPVEEWWGRNFSFEINYSRAAKKEILGKLDSAVRQLKSGLKKYDSNNPISIKRDEKIRVLEDVSDKNVAGMCPVASPKTVCCNLRTIDAVETCVFGCSYCTIQTFYDKDIKFAANLDEKLARIKLEKDRYYHYGSGQSSDALAWGNRNGILDAQCKFASDNPNVMMEFKTKSDNTRYFREKGIPGNVVCSWTLNPEIVIANEEHFTANLDDRIGAAEQIVDLGGKVSFHFHPMVYYQGWETDYTGIAQRLLQMFSPENVLFISYGSVTFIKPVLNKIRAQGNPTRITQMDLVKDPHGKLTYPDEIKVRMFRTMHAAFKNWHGKTFFYLCMEKEKIWLDTFGFSYLTNELFEENFLASCFAKINRDTV